MNTKSIIDGSYYTNKAKDIVIPVLKITILELGVSRLIVYQEPTMKKLLLIISILIFSGTVLGESRMNQNSMEQVVKNMAQSAKGGGGFVEFSYSNITLYLISDVEHDRMRIIAPIAEYNKLTRQQLDAAMEANFDKSLDARYASSEGVLYSAYMHRLSELSESQLISAVDQVVNLALTFGGDYSSGALVYGVAE